MRLPRLRFTVRGLMVTVAVAAVWSYIVAQGIAYREHLRAGYSAWDAKH